MRSLARIFPKFHEISWLAVTLIIFALTSVELLSHRYQIGICAPFKDESPLLKEWIEYHQMLGVNHFWLYDMGSSDNPEETLAPYISRGIVELIPWEVEDENYRLNWIRVNCDGLNRARGLTKWLAFVSVDEFIVPKTVQSLPMLLEQYGKDKVAVSMFWQIFGTSGYWDLPEEALVTEVHLLRGDHFESLKCRDYKTIVQLDQIQDGKLFEIEHVLKQNIDLVSWNFLDHTHTFLPWSSNAVLGRDIIQVNRYWFLDEKGFREQRIPAYRKPKFHHFNLPAPWSEGFIRNLIDDFNRYEDYAIQRFVPELRVILQEEY